MSRSVEQWIRSSALWVLAAYTAIFIAYAYVVPWWHGSLGDSGTFGDTFGAVNAFVSGIAMLGVVAAIFLQAEELKLQRQELADTREELKGQREALEGQVDRWDKDYITRNKPVVFIDKTEDLSGNSYVLRNVGGGFAINVYLIEGQAAPIALGSLAPHSHESLPLQLVTRFRDAAKGLPHIVIAEGPHSRTTQWTPTLNFRTPTDSGRNGYVQHRMGSWKVEQPRGQHQSLSEFLDGNLEHLRSQLAQMVEEA